MIAGFLAPFRGFAWLLRHPSSWRFAAIPIALNVLLVAAVIWAWVTWVAPWAAGLLPDGEGWLVESGRAAAKIVVYVLTLPLVFAVYLVLASLLGGPFYEVLCERVERDTLGARYDDLDGRSLWRMFVDGIRVEVGNLVVAVVGGILALLLPIVVPGAGVFLSLPLGWFLAGFDFIAYPFDRRATGLRRKVGIALRNLPATLGFGLAVWLMLLPIVTLPFVAPCAVVGAALLFPGGRPRGADLPS